MTTEEDEVVGILITEVDVDLDLLRFEDNDFDTEAETLTTSCLNKSFSNQDS